MHFVYRYVISLKARFKRFDQNSQNRPLTVAKDPLKVLNKSRSGKTRSSVAFLRRWYRQIWVRARPAQYDKMSWTWKGNCLRYFALFSPFGSIWKLTVFAVLHCLDTEKTKQRKRWASRFFQNSENRFLVL